MILKTTLLIPVLLSINFSLFFKIAKSENILFFWAVSGTSHRITVWPLVEKLAENGHNVTFLGPLPSKKPNAKVHEIVLEGLLDKIGLGVDFVDARIQGGAPAISKLWSTYLDFPIKCCEFIVSDPALVDWINTSNYDLVVINAMMNDCAYGLVHKFKAPYIIYGTTHNFGWWSEAFGYPDENYPEFRFHYPENMNFLQSIHNALQPLYWQWSRHNYVFPQVEKILREGLNIPEMPSFVEIEQNVSLIFQNTHWSEEHPRSLPPLFVPIGGMHCVDDLKPLSKDLEEFIGKKEFIYFSFGTFANPESFPRRIADSIFNTMGNLSTTQFLVKWIDDSSLTLPKNVKLVKWVSQQDVLGHSNIRAFISHGGLLGTQEAVCHGVATIVIPLFAEQDYNAERVHSRGRGLLLDIGDLTQETLTVAIQEILRNTSYVENTRKVSRLFKDRPQSPLETAVWWVEYVLRHMDTRHLQPIGMKRNWFERRMLPVWLFLTGCGALMLIIVGYITRRLYQFASLVVAPSKVDGRGKKQKRQRHKNLRRHR